MVSHIDGNDLVVVNQQLDCDAIGEVDGKPSVALAVCRPVYAAQRGVVRVQFQQLQGLEVLLFPARGGA